MSDDISSEGQPSPEAAPTHAETPSDLTGQKQPSHWPAYARMALYLLMTLSILGLMGRMFWWADYFAHPRLHLAAALSLMAIIFIIMGDWLRLSMAVAGVALNILIITSSVTGINNTANAMPMPPGHLRVITLNVDQMRADDRGFVEWVTAQQPDILVLVQANRAWLPMLDKLIGSMPYQNMADHTTEYGLAILSRFPMDKTESSVAGPRSLPSLSAEMETPIGRIILVAAHPNPPGGGEDSRARDLYLAQLSAIAQTTTMPTLIVGDLNATPWSSGFEPLRLLPNLQPSSVLVPATWPGSLGMLGLPTQHVLLSIPYSKPRDIFFHEIKAGPAFAGTAHLPLIADLRIRQAN